MLIRQNVGLIKIIGNKYYSIACGIVIKLLLSAENGLPNIENEPELNNLEDDIFAIYETDWNAIVSTIVTTAGFKEFVPYTKNVDEFNFRLENLKIKYPKYELTSYNRKDENWETHKSFK